MKQMTLSAAALFIFTAMFLSCKKEIGNENNLQLSQLRQGVETIKAFFDKYRPKAERFTLDATAGGSFTTGNGTKITFAPNSVIRNGSVVSGPVTVWVRDFLKPSSMLLADKPTATSAGQMLECFGEIIVTAEQDGNALQLAPGAAAQRAAVVTFPIGGGQGQKEIPLWDGDTTITQTLQGYNHENLPVTISTAISVPKGMAWTQIPGGFAAATATQNFFNLDSLGEWRNVDALYNDPGEKTTVLGYFGDKFNNLTGSNYSGQEPSMLFFKTKNTNTLVKLYNVILNPATGKEGLLSYQNMMPVGQEGTFLAISAIGTTLYAEMRDVTIGAPAAGKNYVGIDFTLAEVSESQLLSMIDLLNSK